MTELYYVMVLFQDKRLKISQIEKLDISLMDEKQLEKLSVFPFATMIGVSPPCYTVIGSFEICYVVTEMFMFGVANELSEDVEKFFRDKMLAIYDTSIDVCDMEKRDPFSLMLKPKQ